MEEVYCVVMAGGSGTRLWPASRALYPKQFIAFGDDDRTLFQQTVARLKAASESMEIGFKFHEHPIVIANDAQRFMALDQLREIGLSDSRLLLEPVGRNTAPALTAAALQAMEDGCDPLLVVSPSDQAISNQGEFLNALKIALNEASLGHIVVIGICPDRPETGYGYIRAEQLNCPVSDVRSFVEKPDIQTAQAYLDQGDYYWNGGMFVLRASSWLKALAYFRPDIESAVSIAWEKRVVDGNFVRPDSNLFSLLPSESVDYAVLEPLSTHKDESMPKIRVVPMDAGWSDLGAWDAIWQMMPKDLDGNAKKGDVLVIGSSNNLVHSEGRMVALMNVHNLVVVDTPDALLVADKETSQEVKKIVSCLEDGNRAERSLHRKVHRPWGWYDSIDEDSRFKVKRIQVKPGASLSLQMHHHRAEHWIVVSGTAEVTCGDDVVLLSENESIYIPLGQKHRLYNPGRLPLEIVEVQSGSYLGEDDIVRFEDNYGRVS